MEMARWVDVAVAITVAEAAVLVAWHRRSARVPAPREWALNLVSGLCLMLALRAGLGGSEAWAWMAWLAAAGVAHVADLASRVRRRVAPPGETQAFLE